MADQQYYDQNGQQYYDDQSHQQGTYAASGVDASTAGGDQYTEALPEVLYLMQYCAQAFAPTEDSEEARIAANDSWNPVREWLATHSADEIREAAEQRDDVGKTALHFACQHVPPNDVIETFLATARDIIQWPDSFGWLPIHYACAYGAEAAVIKYLAEAFPESKTTVDRKGRTPLHFFLGTLGTSNTNAPDVVVLLSNTGAASYPTDEGLLPLHLACAYGRTEQTLYVLTEACPEAATTVDNKQRTPLHFVLSNAGRAAAPAAVRLLLSKNPELVNSVGGGALPLLVLAQFASTGINRNDESQMDAVQGCLRHILSARPKPTPEFFSALQRLPSFLQEKAVVMKVVQELLNFKIAERFPTAILLVDFIMWLMVFVGYIYAVLESIYRRDDNICYESREECIRKGLPYSLSFTVDSKSYNPSLDYFFGSDAMVYSIFMFVGMIYFLIRELLQAVSLGALGAFHLYVRDLSNWLNLLYIMLVTTWAVLAMLGTGDDYGFQVGAAVSVMIIIFKFFAYLRTVKIDFAIFTSGVFHVLTRLVTFLFCLSIILIMFARIFYTLYLETDQCKADMNDGLDNLDDLGNPVLTPDTDAESGLKYQRINAIQCGEYDANAWCYHWESMISVITMLLGEVDEAAFMDTDLESGKVQYHPFALFFFCFFFALVVILLANVLIAIVTDSYKVIQDERAAIVFWTNRLNFIAQMDALANGPIWKKLRKIFGLGTKRKKGQQKVEGPKTRFGESAWKRIMDLWFEDDSDSSLLSLEFYCYAMLKLLTIVIVPVWFLIGFASMGALWPPQLREKAFTASVTKLNEADKEDALRKTQVQRLHTEIENLHDELKKELLIDRTQVVHLKSLVAEKKMEIQNEMKHIKRVVTMLFEQQSGM